MHTVAFMAFEQKILHKVLSVRRTRRRKRIGAALAHGILYPANQICEGKLFSCTVGLKQPPAKLFRHVKIIVVHKGRVRRFLLHPGTNRFRKRIQHRFLQRRKIVFLHHLLRAL